jgi:hypothetical protein
MSVVGEIAFVQRQVIGRVSESPGGDEKSNQNEERGNETGGHNAKGNQFEVERQKSGGDPRLGQGFAGGQEWGTM